MLMVRKVLGQSGLDADLILAAIAEQQLTGTLIHILEITMAIDVYLFIEGIKGESTDSTHPGWIEVTSAQWGVKQPKSTTASTGGGHTAERCEHRSLADLFYSHPTVRKVLFNDADIPGVVSWVNHDDHFHVDIRAVMA